MSVNDELVKVLWSLSSTDQKARVDYEPEPEPQLSLVKEPDPMDLAMNALVSQLSDLHLTVTRMGLFLAILGGINIILAGLILLR